MSSILARNALVSNERNMSTSMERLSTGLRINSAKDDAAGLAITAKMTSQIKGLDQAIRNANDGVSLLQTAEGATIEMTNMLQRMRELAVQSATDSNTGIDREYMDLEYQQLTTEIARIATNTQWNGMNILSNNSNFGTGGTVANPDTAGTEIRQIKLQVGANADQTINATFKDFSFGLGARAAASNATVDLSDMDAASTTEVGISIGARAFTVAASIAAESATAAETTTIAAALQAEIRRDAGFEAVSVTGAGNQLVISDSEGRAIAAFTSEIADGTDNGGTLSGGTASTAVVAATPATTAVFGGTARINNTDVSTRVSANGAIAALDNAINNINSERAKFGATISRLEYAADNLASVSANATESRGRILDADYAKETTELARTQIIAQAGTAMLAQANQVKQTVLSLLK